MLMVAASQSTSARGEGEEGERPPRVGC